MRTRQLEQLYRVLAALIIFLMPTNLFYKFFEQSAYVHGLFVDYLLPKLYLTDIPILLVLTLWSIEVVQNKRAIAWSKIRSYWVLVALSGLLILRQLFAPYPFAALWYVLKLIEMAILSGWLFTHRRILTQSLLSISIATTIMFQSVVAYYQYLTQHSVAGYVFLGEAQLSRWAGIAKISLNGTEKILPYGTTAHPNVLGGVMAVYILILLSLKHKKWWIWVSIALGLMTVVLTFSLSAWLTLVVGLAYLHMKRFRSFTNRHAWPIIAISLVIMPLTIHYLAQQYPDRVSLTRRDWLNQAALKMFVDHPLIGVGLNNFTTQVETYTNNREVVRFLQPVHHVGLLWLAETGILGMSLIAILLYRLQRNQSVIRWLIILIPILTLDHYLLSQQTGLLLLLIALKGV